MELLGRKIAGNRAIQYEMTGFLMIVVLIWLDEVLDIPHLLLGAAATPVNWRESLFESLCIAFLCVVSISMTRNLFRRLRYLEGILPICMHCKKIRDEQQHWQQIEVYIRDNSDAVFSHGLCPECATILYPEIMNSVTPSGEPDQFEQDASPELPPDAASHNQDIPTTAQKR